MVERRTTAQRKTDVLAMLERNDHAWLATAAASVPHVIVTQVIWDGESIVIATRQSSRTALNLDESQTARLAFGDSDDAVLMDVELAVSLPAGDAGDVAVTFQKAAGWDPAAEGPDWRYFVLRPVRIQAYRGYGEIEGRDVMKGGRWLA
jgi:Pyridoxamine 5'-phosphate oxidase